jgi:hypothetical protein
MRCSAFESLSAEGLRLGGANVTGTRQHCRSGRMFTARARAGTLPRVALLAGASLAALVALAPVAHAVDGTWAGPDTEWTDGTNWSSTPDVPDTTATFTRIVVQLTCRPKSRDQTAPPPRDRTIAGGEASVHDAVRLRSQVLQPPCRTSH